VNLAEPSEKCEENGPDTNEKGDDEDEDFPFLKFVIPQE
jgi:hypothetical protein